MTDTTRILRHPRTAALCVITLGVAAASAASFAESYRGLFEWAAEHGIRGAWAVFWPLQVDVFIAVGELTLFVALADRWTRRSRVSAWTVTLLGLAASVAGNIGHGTANAWTARLTDAVPPLAAAAALAVGLGVLKRVVETSHARAIEPAIIQPLAQPAMQPSDGRGGSQPLATEASHNVAMTAAAQQPAIEPPAQPSRQPRRTVAAGQPSTERDARAARKAYRESARDGAPLSDRALGARYDQTRAWGAARIREVRSAPSLAEAR